MRAMQSGLGSTTTSPAQCRLCTAADLLGFNGGPPALLGDAYEDLLAIGYHYAMRC